MSGKKQAQQKAGALTGLNPDLRVKEDVKHEPAANEFVAIIHSWDNVLCVGEPQE